MKKLISTVLVTTQLITLPNTGTIEIENSALKQDIESATYLIEEYLKSEYSDLESKIEALTQEKGWDYALTMETLDQNDPFFDVNYEKMITALCMAMENGEHTLLDFDIVTYQANEEGYKTARPVKITEYEMAEDGFYDPVGTRYLTVPEEVQTFKETDMGRFIPDETVVMEPEFTTIPYGDITVIVSTPEEILDSVGMDLSDQDVKDEFDRRMEAIENAGINEVGLSQSVFIEAPKDLFIREEAYAQLTNALQMTSGNRNHLLQTAATLIGKVPYQYGGKSRKAGYDELWYTFDENGKQRGLDCSGYVQWCFRTAGYPEDICSRLNSTAEMLNNCIPVEETELQPGDLGILNLGETTNHVGIYLGNGYFIHCNSHDKTVSITKPKLPIYVRVAGIDDVMLEDVAVMEDEYQPVPVSGYTEDELYLAAQMVWHEARGQGVNGWIGVTEVLKNRLNSDRFPNTIGEVIYQPGQFAGNSEITSMAPSEDEIAIVRMVLNGEIGILNNDEVLFFRNPGAEGDSNWGAHPFYRRILDHVFYT